MNSSDLIEYNNAQQLFNFMDDGIRRIMGRQLSADHDLDTLMTPVGELEAQSTCYQCNGNEFLRPYNYPGQPTKYLCDVCRESL